MRASHEQQLDNFADKSLLSKFCNNSRRFPCPNMLLDMLQRNYDVLQGHSLELNRLPVPTASGLSADSEAQPNASQSLPSSFEWME